MAGTCLAVKEKLLSACGHEARVARGGEERGEGDGEEEDRARGDAVTRCHFGGRGGGWIMLEPLGDSLVFLFLMGKVLARQVLTKLQQCEWSVIHVYSR